MTLLKRIWTDEDEDPEVKILYKYVVDLRDRVDGESRISKGTSQKSEVL